MPRIHYSELEDKFWIRDGEDVLWFDSILDAKDRVRALETREAVDAEVKLIAEYFRRMGMVQIADAIERGDYKP